MLGKQYATVCCVYPHARRRADEASFAAEEDHFNLDGRMRRHTSFPTFAYNHLKNKHGVKHVVRSVRVESQAPLPSSLVRVLPLIPPTLRIS